MEQLILIVYLLLATAMVGLILLQQGRGADAGASFGSGASQTVFGSAGSGNVLTRTTAILATLFFVASVGLAMLAKHKAEALRDGQIPIPTVTESRQVRELPGDLPQTGKETVTIGTTTPSAADGPAAAPASSGAEIPAPGAGNPGPHDVPSAPAPVKVP